jgi:hypothetical protein
LQCRSVEKEEGINGVVFQFSFGAAGSVLKGNATYLARVEEG